VEKTNRLRDDTVRTIVTNSKEIADFKYEVSRQIKGLADYAAEN
jgi:hypothetical protein